MKSTLIVSALALVVALANSPSRADVPGKGNMRFNGNFFSHKNIDATLPTYAEILAAIGDHNTAPAITENGWVVTLLKPIDNYKTETESYAEYFAVVSRLGIFYSYRVTEVTTITPPTKRVYIQSGPMRAQYCGGGDYAVDDICRAIRIDIVIQ